LRAVRAYLRTPGGYLRSTHQLLLDDGCQLLLVQRLEAAFILPVNASACLRVAKGIATKGWASHARGRLRRIGVCHTLYTHCMTMLSFRVADKDAERIQAWAKRLGVDRSELLREALRQHLLRLASENDAATWAEHPLQPGEQTLAAIADWGPAEDWADWADAAR